MLKLRGGESCEGPEIGRRELLRVGGLGLTGLTLPGLLESTAGAAEARAKAAAMGLGSSFGKAKNCIILYLSGGHPQHETFDPKPDSPSEIRGEFGAIATKVPGVHFGELLPKSATLADQVTVVRSMAHTHNDHGRGSYWMFTGTPYAGSVSDVNSMSRQDAPHIGSCVAQLAPGPGPMFPFVIVPHRMDVAGGRRAGQFAGMLGGKYDPLLTGGDPNDDHFRLEHLPLAPGADPLVLRRRLRLVDQINQLQRELHEAAPARSLGQSQQKALDVVGSESVRRAVDLAEAEPGVRERYGRNLFGQSVLLGRRLLDAGARLVQCNWQRTQGRNGFAWDTHWNNFSALREDLAPPFDRAFHALMTDLKETGQIDETLVIVAAEFGRSPKVTLKNSGREHWPDCYSIVLAGAGIRAGHVHGRSDKIGGNPLEGAVSPADLTATIYHCLGIDPHRETYDQSGRPFMLSKGEPVAGILA